MIQRYVAWVQAEWWRGPLVALSVACTSLVISTVVRLLLAH